MVRDRSVVPDRALEPRRHRGEGVGRGQALRVAAMELGFHSIHYSPMFGAGLPILQVIEAAAEAGFDAMGVDGPSIEAHLDDGGSLTEIAAALQAGGLRCTDLIYLAISDDGGVVTASARRLAELATGLRTDLCVAAVTAPLAPEVLVHRLGLAASVLGDAGVRLAVEFLPYGHLATLVAANDVCEAVGWERAGLLLDSLHVFRSGTDLGDVASIAGDHIALVQFSDAVGPRPDDMAEESRHRRRVPGEGDLDLVGFVSAVVRTGFDGPVTAEVLADDIRAGDPYDVATRVLAAMRTHWPTAGPPPRRAPHA